MVTSVCVKCALVRLQDAQYAEQGLRWLLKCIIPFDSNITYNHLDMDIEFSLSIYNLGAHTTVEPLKKGHFGNGTFVLSSEVVLISEVHEIF